VELPRVLAPASPRIALARRRLLETLGARAPGERVEIPPSPLAPGRGRRTLRGKRSTTTGQDAEGETVRAALLGPLAWMGFVAPESSEGPSACRAGIALRALAPDGDTDPLVERPGRVVAQPDFSLVAYPPLTAPLLLTLDTCAEALSLDVVARYRLTREALGRAHRAGLGAEEISRRLEAIGGMPLPANVATTLGDWRQHAERLRLTAGVSLLEVRSTDLLDALLADRTAREWVRQRLTPTAALLVPEHAARAREWLLRRGEFPAWRRG
jgi:hypothetical protein